MNPTFDGNAVAKYTDTSHKIKVGIICGGKSAEHEISLRSAQNVIQALNKEKFEPVLLYIRKSGEWLLIDNKTFTSLSNDTKNGEITDNLGEPITLAPECKGNITNLKTLQTTITIDVAFPILHGPNGEDGTVQGLLQLAGIPFVGSGVLGSALGMDKDVMKRLLRDAGLPIGKFIAAKENEVPTYTKIIENLGIPFFVKPANMGSSIGVHKVTNEDEFHDAIRDAFTFDKKILLEEYIEGREIECSVLGNDEPIASIPGEIVAHHDFYSYEAKYLDEQGAALEIPAQLSPELTQHVQDIAIKTFTTLNCEGFGRVDCFLKPNGDLLVNEINTIPGFTSTSMYPKLWEASGISYTHLIDRLIELAFEKK